MRTEAQPQATVGDTITDVAIVDGSVPAGSELTFEVFKSPVAGDLKHDQNGELTDTAWTQAEVDALNGEAVCTMENLAGRTEPIAVTAGPHSGERYTSPGVK